MKTRRLLFLSVMTLLTSATGCERPPVPEKTQANGPPAVVIVDRKSDQGKKLIAAQNAPHDDFFVRRDIAIAPVNTGAATPAPAPVPAVAPAVVPPAAPAPPATPATQPTESPAAPNGAATPPADARPAAADVGKKAQEYGSGFIATPIGALTTVREKLPMIQIEQALQLFKAQNDRPPRDLAEFTEQILKPANIKLPELGEGESYFFDPKEGKHGTLMIRKPQAAANAGR